MISGRGRAVLLVGLPAVLAVGLWVGQRPALTHDVGFRVTGPADGTSVARDLTLTWTRDAAAASYAVVVDIALPRPGQAVPAGEHVITLDGRSLQLTLGAARTGSPSAREMHTLTVVPLDGLGRRIGEDVASVRLRSRR